MGILTFKGGVHPYDGKELSKNSPVVKYLPGVCLITDPFVCFRYGKRNRTAPDSNRFYGQFHYH